MKHFHLIWLIPRGRKKQTKPINHSSFIYENEDWWLWFLSLSLISSLQSTNHSIKFNHLWKDWLIWWMNVDWLLVFSLRQQEEQVAQLLLAAVNQLINLLICWLMKRKEKQQAAHQGRSAAAASQSKNFIFFLHEEENKFVAAEGLGWVVFIVGYEPEAPLAQRHSIPKKTNSSFPFQPLCFIIVDW